MSAKPSLSKPSKPSKAKPTLNKAEQRAQQQGWSEPERQARKRIARVLRLCRNHYRSEGPIVQRLMMTSIHHQMKRALQDCKSLDWHRVERGNPPIYVEGYTYYESKGALDALHIRALAWCNELREMKRPWLAAASKGDQQTALGKMTLEMVKESIRDLWSPDQAWEINSEQIQQRQNEKNLGFSKDFGEFLRRHSTSTHRSVSEWILRAWLPLCLWECGKDGADAHDRCVAAGDLIGLAVPSFTEFRNAWGNVLYKKLKASRK